MARLITVLLVALVGVVAGCSADAPAQINISFRFDSAPPADVPYWLTVRVTADNGARTLVSSTPTAWSADWRLKLDQVPNGSGREVRVEFRRGTSADLRVEFYGISDPFSVAPGELRAVSVRIQPRRPLPDSHNAVQASVGDSEPSALADPRLLGDATLHIITRDAVSVSLSNEPDFSGAEVLTFATPTAGITCEQYTNDQNEVLTACVRPGWDLRARSSAATGGVYAVHARFRDAEGYASAPIVAQVAADVDPPVLLNATVIPPVSAPGRATVISITANEPLLPPVLTVTPALTWPLVGPTSADNKTWSWRGAPTELSESHTFTVVIADANGQAPRTIQLRERPEDPGSDLLTLMIDMTEPQVWPGYPFVVTSNEGVRREFERDTVIGASSNSEFEFEVVVRDDQEVGAVRVFVESDRLPCEPTIVDRFEWVLSCVYDLATTEFFVFEGSRIISITATDSAGNQASEVAYQLRIDDTPPEAFDPVLFVDREAGTATFGWDGLTIGQSAAIEVMASISEPLKAPPIIFSDLGWVGSGELTGTGHAYSFDLSGAELGVGLHTLSLELIDGAGNFNDPVIGLLTVAN